MFGFARTLVAIGVTAAIGVGVATAPALTAQGVNADAKTFADFQERVKDYLALRNKFAGGIEKLPEKATAQQMDTRQRALNKAVITARSTAKRGDIFGPTMPALVRRLLAPIFKGPDGKIIRESIFEEPHPVVPAVNVRYPDEVPLSTMPPDILKMLPALPGGLEFRFIGHHLILLDVEAHLIVDVIDNAMPASPREAS